MHKTQYTYLTLVVYYVHRSHRAPLKNYTSAQNTVHLSCCLLGTSQSSCTPEELHQYKRYMLVTEPSLQQELEEALQVGLGQRCELSKVLPVIVH